MNITGFVKLEVLFDKPVQEKNNKNYQNNLQSIRNKKNVSFIHLTSLIINEMQPFEFHHPFQPLLLK